MEMAEAVVDSEEDLKCPALQAPNNNVQTFLPRNVPPAQHRSALMSPSQNQNANAKQSHRLTADHSHHESVSHQVKASAGVYLRVSVSKSPKLVATLQLRLWMLI